MKYRKVTENDNWGNITTKVGTEDLIIPKSRRLKVQFPDGYEGELPVVLKSHFEGVSDMGHNYNVGSVLPYVQLSVHGMKVEVRLGKSGLKVAQ